MFVPHNRFRILIYHVLMMTEFKFYTSFLTLDLVKTIQLKKALDNLRIFPKRMTNILFIYCL
jgi:hypothetical protein